MAPSNTDVDMRPATPPGSAETLIESSMIKDRDMEATTIGGDKHVNALPVKAKEALVLADESNAAKVMVDGKNDETTAIVNIKDPLEVASASEAARKGHTSRATVASTATATTATKILQNGDHKMTKSLIGKESRRHEANNELGERGRGRNHHKNEKIEDRVSRHVDDQDVDHDTHQPSDEKYKRLKRKLKQVLEENERLSIELGHSNRRARQLRQEKNLLLDRLCAYERESDSSPDTLSSLSSDSDVSDSSVNSFYQSRSRRASPLRATSTAPSSSKKQSKVTGTNKSLDVPSSAPATTHHPKKTVNKAVAGTGIRKQTSGIGKKEDRPVSTPSTITNVGSATQKPKRIHNTTKLRPVLSSKVRKVQPIERDEHGNVKLPVTVGIITIMDLGHVVYDREAFHNERYIWPVGYKMSRSYNSMIDPTQQTTYTCSVIDDGEAPKFQIDAEDQPGKPIIAGTATGAWTHVVKAANSIRKRDHSNSASGPDYFGFSNATIAKMIQDLPNADKCKTYIMQRYEEPSTKSSSEKRKVAAALGSKNGKASGNGDGEDDQLEDDDGGDEGDDSDTYASLGTPNKKKSRLTESPTIRRAGFGSRKEEEEMGGGYHEEEEEVDELEEGGEEEVDELEGENDETMSDGDIGDIGPVSNMSSQTEPTTTITTNSSIPITSTYIGASVPHQERAESELVEIEDSDMNMDSTAIEPSSK
ncbi:hypothetical protein BX616_000554 [Lobosporangium transversale]|nr:hypothetical protein BX616_000554 [Lobosporangium transversale]